MSYFNNAANRVLLSMIFENPLQALAVADEALHVHNRTKESSFNDEGFHRFAVSAAAAAYLAGDIAHFRRYSRLANLAYRRLSAGNLTQADLEIGKIITWYMSRPVVPVKSLLDRVRHPFLTWIDNLTERYDRWERRHIAAAKIWIDLNSAA